MTDEEVQVTDSVSASAKFLLSKISDELLLEEIINRDLSREQLEKIESEMLLSLPDQ